MIERHGIFDLFDFLGGEFEGESGDVAFDVGGRAAADYWVGVGAFVEDIREPRRLISWEIVSGDGRWAIVRTRQM